MATTVQSTQNSNVTLKEVKEKIAKYYHNQGTKIQVDTKKSPGDVGVNLFLNVDEDSPPGRVDIQAEILEKVFPGNSSLIEKGQTGGGTSTLGAIIVGPYTRGSKDRYVRIVLKRSGKAMAGIGNEVTLINQINFYAKGTGGITIKFKPKIGDDYTIDNVIEAVGVGSLKKVNDLSDKSPELYPKSDVNLIRSKGDPVPVSIKQDDGDLWASVESWYYKGGFKTHVNDQSAEWYLKTAANTKNGRKLPDGSTANFIDIEQVSNVYILTNPRSRNKENKVALVWKASDKMIDVAVFGSDILGKGLVVKKTFRPANFKMDDLNKILEVQTSQNIVSKEDVRDDVFVTCYYVSNRSLKYTKNKVEKNIKIAVRVGTRHFALGKYGTNKIWVENKNGSLVKKLELL